MGDDLAKEKLIWFRFDSLPIFWRKVF